MEIYMYLYQSSFNEDLINIVVWRKISGNMKNFFKEIDDKANPVKEFPNIPKTVREEQIISVLLVVNFQQLV